MAQLPLTSKELNQACLCVTAWLCNLSCTRKCLWHLFSESRQQPEQFGLCFPYLCTEENRPMKPWAGPISWHTVHLASLPPEKDTVTRDHPPLIQSLVGNMAGCHWPEREAPPHAVQMEVGCPEANSLAQSSSWATAWARWLLEAIVYSWCWIQPRVESRFQPMYTHMLCSESSFSLKESIPDHLTSPSTVSSGDKKHLKINQNSRHLAILY